MTASNPFIVIPTEADRSSYVDVAKIAQELAKAWGAEVGECEEGAFGIGRVLIDGLTIYVRGGLQLSKIDVGASCPALERKLSHYARPEFPRASADTAKGIEKLAADLKRRVVDKAQAPLATLQASFSAQCGHRENLKAHAEAMRAAVPGLEVSISADETDTTAALRGNAGGLYFTGRLSSSGSVSFDRVGSIGNAKALKVLAALFAAEEA